MSSLLIFILVLTFGVIPLALFVYWFRYKHTILQKSAYVILFSTYIIAITSFIVGRYGINNLLWYIPVGYLVLLIGNRFLTWYVQKPIKSTTEVLDKVAEGNLDVTFDEELRNRKDETGQMDIALEHTVNNLRESVEFARQIGEGNLDYDIKLLGDNDHLRKALLEMKNKLKEAAKIEEEKRKEEEKRRWHNEGLAKMNEILRQDYKLEDLAYKIINFFVDYLGANQGGIFVKSESEDDELVFDLKAAYAFDRRKYINRSFKPGESLVGTCAIEKEKIHMTEIPDDYIRITSGLGDANPGSLLLIPMKVEDEVLGVIEIASFKNFEDYEIEFVEEASLSIASTLQASETNKRTKELLEKTQQQAEEMSAQEEEMRQNMEELKATQEEATRKAQENEKQLSEAYKYQKELEEKLEKAYQKIRELEKE
ncbi:MAG: GAF domain-containing protein [Bacteroidales bacterium]